MTDRLDDIIAMYRQPHREPTELLWMASELRTARAELLDAEPAVRAMQRRLKRAESARDAARAELARVSEIHASSLDNLNTYAATLKARLDAVLALCDDCAVPNTHREGVLFIDEVRAAATGSVL